ncbi:GHKL domain-containing protein [bacterium]|nr:MAG: GHKL domain-containing protein [bacterium]
MVYLLFFFAFQLLTQENVQWKSLSFPGDKPYIIDSRNASFTAIKSQNQSLYVTKDLENWSLINAPESQVYLINYFIAGDNEIWALSISNDYSTTTFVYRNYTWLPVKLSSDLPLHEFSKSETSNIAIGGDDANLFVKAQQKDSWEKIQTPFKSHITELNWLGDSLWVGVRNEGVFSYRNDVWTSYSVHGNVNYDILFIGEVSPSGRISFLSSTGHYYVFDSENRVFLEQQGLVQATSNTLGSSLVNSDSLGLLIADQNGYYRLPNSMRFNRIPQAGHIQSVGLSHTKKWVVTDKMGGVYVEQERKPVFFSTLKFRNDLMHVPNVSDLMMIQANLKNPENVDWIFWGKEFYTQLHIYTKTEIEYADYTSLIWPTSAIESFDFLIPIDVDNDGDDELLTVNESPTEIELKLFYNFLGKLSEREHFSISTKDLKSIRDVEIYDWNNDGLNDVILVSHYSNGLREGGLFLFKNSWGFLFKNEPKRIPNTEGWLNTVLIEDVNLDGKEDLYIGNSWREDQLFLGPFLDEKYELKNGIYLPEKSNSYYAYWVNLDENPEKELVRFTNKNGYEVLRLGSEKDFLVDTLFSKSLRFIDSGTLIFTDLDNDSRMDVLVGNIETKRSKVLLNTGNRFVEKPDYFDIYPLESPLLYPIDIDHDNDMDILLTHHGETELVLNQSIIKPSSESEIVGNQRFAKYKLSNGSVGLAKWTLAQILYIGTTIWFYLYVLEAVITLLLMLIAIKIGLKRFNWPLAWVVVLILIDSGAFWLTLVYTAEFSKELSYFIPGLVSAVGMYFPFVFSLNPGFINKKQQKASQEKALFEVLMRYSHGAWSSSLINRLIMLLKNTDELQNQDYQERIQARYEQFKSIMIPELENVHLLATGADIDMNLVQALENAISDYKVVEYSSFINEPEDVVWKLNQIKSAVKEIRKKVWERNSTNLEALIDANFMDWKTKCEENDIHFTIEMKLKDAIILLIPAATLLSILDNLIQNAIRAIQKNRTENTRELTIRIFKKAPKWRIEISDTGCGISGENFGKVFESGFSEFESTGLGLYQARQELKQFGGRIDVQSSVLNKRTVFEMELLEVDSK